MIFSAKRWYYKRGDLLKTANRLSVLALIVSICALGVATVPDAIALWARVHATSASFSEPSPNEQVGRKVDVVATWKRKSDSDDLWLVVRSGIEGRWYTFARLGTAERSGSYKNTIGPVGTGPQEVEIILVPESVDGPLIDIFNGLNNGLSQLPIGSRLLAYAEIQVSS